MRFKPTLFAHANVVWTVVVWCVRGAAQVVLLHRWTPPAKLADGVGGAVGAELFGHRWPHCVLVLSRGWWTRTLVNEKGLE